jgi:hypothetical protein
VEEAKTLIASSPTETVRLLFLQTKMSEYINAEDVTSFGAAVQAFLVDPAYLKGVRTNDAMARQWHCYDALRAAAGKGLAPDVTLVFTYAGDWMNMGFPNVRLARRTQLANLRASFANARFAVDIMDCDELLKSSLRSGVAVTKTIKDIKLMELPSRSAAPGFIGVVSAEALIAGLSQQSENGAPPSLDDTLFLDNPRYFRGESERWNSGAAGLADSINDELQSQVVLCHNGINIVARDARRDPADPAAIILVTPMIVNGCQSCYTLNSLRGKLDGTDLVVKIAVTRNEVLKDNIIRGSNTQEIVDDYDMLSRHTYVRELEREFDRAAPDTRLWLERRWNERELWQQEDPGFDFDRDDTQDRILTPRQIMDGFAATILGQAHEAHGRAQTVLSKVATNGTARGVKIFAPGQEPTIYRAVGWMIAAGRKWGRFSRHLWMDGPKDPDNRGYWARHHFLLALWRVSDTTPDAVEPSDIARAPTVQRRFEALIEKMTEPAARNRLTNLAGQAVENAESAIPAWNRKNPDKQVPVKGRNASARFRDLVRMEADKLR